MDEEQSNLIKRAANPPTNSLPLKTLLKEDTPFKEKLQNDESFCKNYIFFSICFILGLIFFLFYGYKTTLNDSKLSRLIEKPILDSRTFKYIELNNDIRIFLVQDNTTETSSLSLELGVGFNAETGEIPGISHMLAHLILMNSKSYPNFYFEYFLKNHGGDANLVIDMERTNLFFSVNFQFFEKALEMFVWHLKEPNFLKETFHETIELIEQEFSDEIESNNNKIINLVKKISDPKHIFSKLFVGNKESLYERPNKNKIDILSEIEWYFNEYYSGNLMNIAIVSNHSIDFLEKIGKEHFLHLKNNRMASKNMALYPKPFDFNEISKTIFFESDTNDLELSLIFPMEEIISKFRTKPLEYIISLINNKGKDGFYDLLIKKQLIYDMQAEILYRSSDFTLFICKFSIPNNSYENVKEVIKFFYAYIDLLNSNGVKRELFYDMAKISNIIFNFDEKNEDFFSEAQKISKNLNVIPLLNLLNGDQIFFEFDEKMISTFISYINPKNSITTITKKGFDIDEESVRMQQINREDSETFKYIENNSNNDSESHIFRFTDLNSLKEELKVLKEKSSFKNKMLPNKYNVFLANETLQNETDFSEIMKISLDSFDDLNRIYYKILPLSEKTLLDFTETNYLFLNESVKLPDENQFIPKNLSMFSKCKETNHSNSNVDKSEENNHKNSLFFKLNSEEYYNISINNVCIKENDKTIQNIDYNQTSFQIFYKFEHIFNIPKISIYFDLIFNSTVYTTKTNMLFLIVSQTLNGFIERKFHQAIAAGVYFDIKANHHGFEIYLEGFNDGFVFICEKFLNEFFIMETNEFIFKRIKENLIAKIKEERMDDPIKKSIKMFQKIMSNYNHIYQEKIYELESIDFKVFEDFLASFKENLIINKIFIYGNYLKNDSFLIIDAIIKSFNEARQNITENSNMDKNKTENENITLNVSKNQTFESKNVNNLTNGTNSSNLESQINLTNLTNSSINKTIIINNSNISIIDNKTIDSKPENISLNFSTENLKESNSTKENIRSLFYSNVSYIPLTFLNISSMNIRFFFDDQKNDFEDKFILLNYFQLGPRIDSKNSSIISIISLYLDTKLDDFLRNFTDFPQSSIKKSITTHLEKNIVGLLVVLEIKNDLNITCVEYLLEKFYEIAHYEISEMTKKEFETLKNKTLYTLSKIDLTFRHKNRRLWQEILNGHAVDYFQLNEMKNLVQNMTKMQIHDFYFENFINRTNKLSIKIVRKDQKHINETKSENHKNVDSVCGINVKIHKKLEYYKGNEVEENGLNSEKNQEKLRKDLETFSENSKKDEIENIKDMKNIPKYVFFF